MKKLIDAAYRRERLVPEPGDEWVLDSRSKRLRGPFRRLDGVAHAASLNEFLVPMAVLAFVRQVRGPFYVLDAEGKNLTQEDVR